MNKVLTSVIKVIEKTQITFSPGKITVKGISALLISVPLWLSIGDVLTNFLSSFTSYT